MDKQKPIKRARKQIESIEQAIATIENLPELRGVDSIFVSATNSSVYIVAAFDLETYRHNRGLLKRAGWEIYDARIVGSGDDRQSRLTRGDEEIVYCMDAAKAGSTCTRVQVGTEESPVYKVTCKEK